VFLVNIPGPAGGDESQSLYGLIGLAVQWRGSWKQPQRTDRTREGRTSGRGAERRIGREGTERTREGPLGNPDPPGTAARHEPVGPVGAAARRIGRGVRGGGERREAIADPTKAEVRREVHHRRRSGSRAKDAEVAWGCRVLIRVRIIFDWFKSV
jgi:hypothetical protein